MGCRLVVLSQCRWPQVCQLCRRAAACWTGLCPRQLVPPSMLPAPLWVVLIFLGNLSIPHKSQKGSAHVQDLLKMENGTLVASLSPLIGWLLWMADFKAKHCAPKRGPQPLLHLERERARGLPFVTRGLSMAFGVCEQGALQACFSFLLNWPPCSQWANTG